MAAGPPGRNMFVGPTIGGRGLARARSRASAIQVNNSRFAGRAGNPCRRRPSTAAASSSLEGPLPDRCHSCLLPTRPRQETVPTREYELLLAPESLMIHFFSSVHTRAVVPASNSSYHPATTGNGCNPPLLTAIGVSLDNWSTNTRSDTDPTSCQYHDDQQTKQSQGTSPIAAHLKTPTHAVPSLQSQPPVACLPGFRPSRPSQSLWSTPPNLTLLFRPETAAEHRRHVD